MELHKKLLVSITMVGGTLSVDASEAVSLTQEALVKKHDENSLVVEMLAAKETVADSFPKLVKQLVGHLLIRHHPIVPFILKKISLRLYHDSEFKRDNHLIDRLITTSPVRGIVVTTGHKQRSNNRLCELKLWNLPAGECSKIFSGHSGKIIDCQFNLSGSLLVTASEDRTARLWNVATGECLQTFSGHTEALFSAKFNTRENLIITTSQDATVKFWDIASGSCLKTFSARSPEASPASSNGPESLTIQLNDQESFMLTDCGVRKSINYVSKISNTVKLWNCSTGDCLKTFPEGLACLESLGFDHSGDLILLGSNDENGSKPLYLWSIALGRFIKEFNQDEPSIYDAAFNQKRDRVIIISKNKCARILSVNDNECVGAFPAYEGCLLFEKLNKAGDLLLTVFEQNNKIITRLMSTVTGKPLSTYSDKEDVGPGAFHPKENLMVTCDPINGNIKIWDLNTDYCVRSLSEIRGQPMVELSSLGDLVIISFGSRFTIIDIQSMINIVHFFMRDDLITLRQALVLIAIYEVIVNRRLFALESSQKKGLVAPSTVVFDFTTYKHLQKDYEGLPSEIQQVLDPYVKKIDVTSQSSAESTTHGGSVYYKVSSLKGIS